MKRRVDSLKKGKKGRDKRMGTDAGEGKPSIYSMKLGKKERCEEAGIKKRERGIPASKKNVGLMIWGMDKVLLVSIRSIVKRLGEKEKVESESGHGEERVVSCQGRVK